MKKINLLMYSIFVLSALVCMTACSKDDESENEPEDSTVVNLGLPSGTRWAKTNIGAANPWNYGDYFAWGETKIKEKYDWDTYYYCDGTPWTLTKYCTDTNEGKGGFSDGLTTLESIDDVATTVLGDSYSIPTSADWCELCNQCYWIWTSNYNGQNVSGYIIYKAKTNSDKGIKVFSNETPSALYSLSDDHIFLPAASYRWIYPPDREGGSYWSATLDETHTYSAWICYFFNDGVFPSGSENREIGHSVRPIRRK